MTKFFLLLSCILFSQVSFAQAPTSAHTFDTNVEIRNADSAQIAKIRSAEELIKAVVATDEFREDVLNHTYKGRKTFVDNDGLTNLQIYNKMLEAAEDLNRIKDNEMDLILSLYYKGNTSTVGYTTPRSTIVNINTKFFNKYTAAEVARNMTHEWLHKMGFGHAFNYSVSRDYSVPYAIGSIMEKHAKIIGIANGTIIPLRAPSNVTLNTANFEVSLKWNAATSSAGIREYKIYRRLSGASSSYLQGTTKSLSFKQTQPWKSATYYVKAIDGKGKSVESETVKYVRAPLPAPANLTLLKSGKTVTLKWVGSAAAKEYKIFRKQDGSDTYYLQGETSEFSYSQSSPSRNATYYVKAIDEYGETAKSTSVRFLK